jgi:hypothetical protein
MVSFEDYESVTVDQDDDTFTIEKENGMTYTYKISEERSLYRNIINSDDLKDDIYELSSEEVDEYGNRYYS